MHFGWAYDGVNGSVPRNTGPECASFLTPSRKILETVIVIPLCILSIKMAIARLKPITFRRNTPFITSTPQHHGSPLGYRSSSISHLANSSNHNLQHHYQRIGTSGHHLEPDHRELLLQQTHHRRSSSVEYCSCHRCNNAPHNPTVSSVLDGEAPSWAKQLLLVTMTLTLGVEVGFKFATRTVIYILNPCHITTIIQIYLLACNKPKKSTTALFRLQMNFLNGPLLAFMFPETDSRQLPLEASIYWIQHALMCIIPVFLLRYGGVYNMEAMNDFTWNVIGYAIIILYHYIVLQIVSIPTQVNLNHMLCPAIKDPFDGPNYRAMAVVHEAILCTLLCKIVTFIFNPLPPPIITNPPFIKNGGSASMEVAHSAAPSPLAAKSAPPGVATHHYIHSRPSSRPSSRSSSPAKTVSMLQENNIIIKTSKID
ncbi:transmembrane protein 164 [Armigeres subalbatus]|uniref:transmembrane protein 164 n=1 Tax=Armigeres subalbatus TaxID=124917 RepID=UPI002ED167FA